MFRIAAVAVLTLELSSAAAMAADKEITGASTTAAPVATTAAATPVAAGDVDWSLPPVRIGAPSSRPAVLPALYVGLAGLQAFDGYSTVKALSRGAREMNPLMQGAVGSPSVVWGIKVAATAIPIVLAERMWKTNRVGAIVMMAVANGAMAAVATNNARVMRQLQ